MTAVFTEAEFTEAIGPDDAEKLIACRQMVADLPESIKAHIRSGILILGLIGMSPEDAVESVAHMEHQTALEEGLSEDEADMVASTVVALAAVDLANAALGQPLI